AFNHILTFPIVPEHLLSGIIPSTVRENSFSNYPVGSGPFKFRFTQNIDTASSRKVIYMANNQDYYNGTTHLARFQLHIYDTRDAIIRALALNEVNAAAGLHSTDLTNIDDKRYEVDTAPVQSGVYAIINTKSEALKDIEVRRALQIGTDTQAIREKIPVSVPSLDLPFTNNQLTGGVPKAPSFDHAAAAALLDKAGWKLNGENIRVKDKKELKLSVVTVKNSEFERVLEGLAGQWRSLGIVVEAQIVDPNDVAQGFVQNVLQPRSYDVLVYQLNIGADPDVYAYWHSSQTSAQGFNFANYSNAVSDDALSSARARAEPDLRNAKYITFAKQWLSDVPAIGLYQSTTQYVHSRNVRSFDKSTTLVSPIDRYSDVLQWSVGSRSVYKTP
ncbi:MAG TPA: ABC transporter substrate-binding protein, partial [Candidatus Saccharimonadales bacterium]|nr:ABC transporter substrate-binding protein [Candidatus Saccharimonadales bacterium]